MSYILLEWGIFNAHILLEWGIYNAHILLEWGIFNAHILLEWDIFNAHILKSQLITRSSVFFFLAIFLTLLIAHVFLSV